MSAFLISFSTVVLSAPFAAVGLGGLSTSAIFLGEQAMWKRLERKLGINPIHRVNARRNTGATAKLGSAFLASAAAIYGAGTATYNITQPGQPAYNMYKAALTYIIE